MKKARWVVITGLDWSWKTTLKDNLKKYFDGFSFKLPYHEFVREWLKISGNGKILKDIHTDVSLFVADARITNYKIKKWKKNHQRIISQRWRMDHFIFNQAQNLDYQQTIILLKPEEMEKPDLSIYLVSNPKIAYERIKNDPNKDKYETLKFMKVQYDETLRFFKEIDKNSKLKKIFTEEKIIIDTTNLTKNEVFEKALEIIRKYISY